MQAADRTILHMDLDTFFVSVECLKDSRLKGKPLMVGGKSDRAVVAACSYEARAFGIHSAMPMRLARRLCPNAIIISGDMDAYSKYSRLVTDVVAEEAPLFEKSSIDEFYLDLSGLDRFFGSYKWSTALRKRITKETGLPISFGLSVNKMVSKVATGEAKPDGQLRIIKGTERDFLAPMSIAKIPMVGEKTYRFLRGMGISRVSVLREMPREMLGQMMGKNGIMLWKRANAIDNSPVVPYHEAKSMSTERTFQQDTMDINHLRSLLTVMVEKLTYKLRESGKLVGCLAVKIRYASFDTFQHQSRIAYTSADHTLIHKALELFEQLYERRMMIRLIGVRFSDLVQGHYQINLFEDTEEMIRLYQAMDVIRSRHGPDKVHRAVGMGLTSAKREINPFMKE